MLSIAEEPPATEPLHIDFGPAWDLGLDALVLAGEGGRVTLDHLHEQGHRRIIVFLPESSSERPDARVRTVRSDTELWTALLSMSPPPRNVILRRVPGGGISSELHHALGDTIKGLAFNRATVAEKGETWVRNTLRNMRHLAQRPSIAFLKNAFAKRPCVIVSAGPSLSKNIARLPELAAGALIIAGNRSVAPLRHAGIAPHLVVVADPIDLRYQLGNGQLEGAGGLVLDLVVHPGMYELEARRHFTYTSILDLHATTFGALGQEALLRAGGSVATTSLALALELGCDPILFVGQDLAITGDRYYVETAHDGAARVSVNGGLGTFEGLSPDLINAVRELHGGLPDSRKPVQSFLSVRGWDGQPVYTSLQFDNYRRWLENKVAELGGSVRVVNCTEGGAYIQNMEHLTLAQASAGLGSTPLDVGAVLDRAQAAFDPRRHKKLLEAQIVRMQRALNSADAEVTRCETLVSQLRTRPVAFKQLDKEEKKLRASLAQVPFVSAWAGIEIEAAQRCCANATSLEDTIVASRTLYAIVRKSARAARPLLSETLQHVRGSGA